MQDLVKPPCLQTSSRAFTIDSPAKMCEICKQTKNSEKFKILSQVLSALLKNNHSQMLCKKCENKGKYAKKENARSLLPEELCSIKSSTKCSKTEKVQKTETQIIKDKSNFKHLNILSLLFQVSQQLMLNNMF